MQNEANRQPTWAGPPSNIPLPDGSTVTLATGQVINVPSINAQVSNGTSVPLDPAWFSFGPAAFAGWDGKTLTTEMVRHIFRQPGSVEIVAQAARQDKKVATDWLKAVLKLV